MCHFKHEESVAAKSWFSNSITWGRERDLRMTSFIDHSIIRMAHNIWYLTMWKSSEVYNNNIPKKLPWLTLRNHLPHLPNARTAFYTWDTPTTIDQRCPLIPIDLSLYSRPRWQPYSMQLRNASEQAFPPCPCSKQRVDGKTVWVNHHVFPGPSNTEAKKDADCYSPKTAQVHSHDLFQYLWWNRSNRERPPVF